MSWKTDKIKWPVSGCIQKGPGSPSSSLDFFFFSFCHQSRFVARLGLVQFPTINGADVQLGSSSSSRSTYSTTAADNDQVFRRKEDVICFVRRRTPRRRRTRPRGQHYFGSPAGALRRCRCWTNLAILVPMSSSSDDQLLWPSSSRPFVDHEEHQQPGIPCATLRWLNTRLLIYLSVLPLWTRAR